MTTPEPWGSAPQQPGGNMPQPYRPASPPATPAGWYPNPQHGHMQWWDGYQWGRIAPPQTIVVRAVKSAGVAYLLLALLGGLGIHRFYLGRIGTAVTLLLMWILGWVTTGLGIGVILLGACVIWWIVDLFLIPSIVREENARIYIAPQHRPLPPAHY